MTTQLQCLAVVNPTVAPRPRLLLPSTIFSLCTLLLLVAIFAVFLVAAMAGPVPASSSFLVSAVKRLC